MICVGFPASSQPFAQNEEIKNHEYEIICRQKNHSTPALTGIRRTDQRDVLCTKKKTMLFAEQRQRAKKNCVFNFNWYVNWTFLEWTL